MFADKTHSLARNLGFFGASVLLATVVAIGLTTSFAATSQTPSTRTYTTPNHGRLELVVPKAWKDSISQPPGDLPPTITFSPAQGSNFKFLVTPVWSVTSEHSFNSSEKIRALLESRGQKLLAQAVEKRVVLNELKGPTTAGYFFTLTDRSYDSTNSDDYKYATQGAIAAGNLLVTFTFLTNKKDAPELQRALEVLKSAIQKLK